MLTTLRQRIYRIRCWLRGHHVARPGAFRYDVSGVCDDCGKVGTGQFPASWSE